MILAVIWWNTNCVCVGGGHGYLTVSFEGLIFMGFRTSMLCPTFASNSLQNTACLRSTRAFFSHPTKKKLHKIQGWCLSEEHLHLSVFFSLLPNNSKKFLLLSSWSRWKLLMAILDPFAFSLNTPGLFHLAEIAYESLEYVYWSQWDPIWIDGCHCFLQKLVFLPLKSPCRLHTMQSWNNS